MDYQENKHSGAEEERTWWIWKDLFLEEWFYTDIDISQTPGLHQQLLREGIVIHKVEACSGVGAIEKFIPGYRKQRGQVDKKPNLSGKTLN